MYMYNVLMTTEFPRCSNQSGKIAVQVTFEFYGLKILIWEENISN